MNKPRVLSTTPIADVKVLPVIGAAALVTVYYRMPLPFLLLVLCLSYLTWSYYWTLKSCRSTTGKSSATGENIFAGETFTLKCKFFNNWSLPLVRCGISFLLPAELTCSSNIPQTMSKTTKTSYVPVTTLQLAPTWDYYTVHYAWLPEKKEINLSLQIQAGLRGIYYLPPPHLFVGDPSGLYRGLTRVDRGQNLYVFPRLKTTGELFKALDFQENNRENNFGLEDRYQTQGVRDYQPTDPSKSINWYATARSNSPKTNIYQRKDSQFCLVVFDLCVAEQPVGVVDESRFEDPKLEEAISLAAGLALFHLEQGAMTAFFTNATLLQWKKKQDETRPDSTSAYMTRHRKITTMDFAAGTRQAQSILKLCAAIDESSRAYPETQPKLWKQIQGAPANTLVYLLGYHNPPASWEHIEDKRIEGDGGNPADFYTPQRIAGLTSARVRRINLSGL